MKIKVLDIPEEGMDLSARAEGDRWFGVVVEHAYRQDYRKEAPARLELHLLRTCNNVSLIGSVEVRLHPVCHRCLEGFEKRLAIPLHVNLAPAVELSGQKGEEREGNEEDLNFSFYKGEFIDLGEIVREMLVLEIPLKYLCKESCKGLCPRCGRNLNPGPCPCAPAPEDPRFAPLKKLLK